MSNNEFRTPNIEVSLSLELQSEIKKPLAILQKAFLFLTS